MSKKATTAGFIANARLVHGDKYDYSCVEYDGNKIKVCIKCPEHGEFWQKPNVHLSNRGCPECGGRKKLTTEIFISRSRVTHGNKYDYSGVEYKNNHEKVLIACPDHGEFLQSPWGHISGYGCNLCRHEFVADLQRLTLEEFVSRSRKTHGNRYGYSRSAYINSREPILIECRDHGEFWQLPAFHIRGSRCPKCANESMAGFSRQKYIKTCNEKHGGMSSLYIVRMFGGDESFFKVGISVQSLASRFSGKSPYAIEELAVLSEEAAFVWDLETQLHRLLADRSYTPSIRFDGDTECFSEIPSRVMRMVCGAKESSQMNLIT